jgi:hypothetical protein
MIMHVINGGSRKFIVLRSVLVVVLLVLSCHIFAERTMGCCVTDVDMWVGKTATDAANKQDTLIYICKGETAYFYAECTVEADPECKQIEWKFDFDDSSSATEYTWSTGGPCEADGDTFDMDVSHDYSSIDLFLPSVVAKRVDADGCEFEVDSCVVDTDTKMKLEKVGDTVIESSNNYSENTTIRITAVSDNGETCSCFEDTVYVAEDTSDPGYIEIYSQNISYGADLPSSVTFTCGAGQVQTIVAKSLAGPKTVMLSPPDAARIITTNYDVWHLPGYPGYLAVPQWTNDLGQVHNKSSGDVYDWFETRTADIFSSVSGDLATVLSKINEYTQCTDSHGGGTSMDHTGTPAVCFNPHFDEMRVDSNGGNVCSQARTLYHTNTVIHEARHCYQDYLSSVDLGQTNDKFWWPDNDDDQDWLVETVPIGPSNYILDTTTSRTTCSGSKSFSGDGTADSWGNNAEMAIEKDAYKYADDND